MDTVQVNTVHSILPALAFLLPLAAGTLVLALRNRGRWVSQSIAVLASGATFAIGVAMASRVLEGVVLTCWENELRVDSLSALLAVVVGGIGFLATVYSAGYSPGTDSKPGAPAGARRPVSVFYGLVLWFLATMIWGSVTNNLVMLYVAVEATTLTSGLLVAYYWDRRALEAGYKYLMLLTIGITFALVGCVLIYAAGAATGKLAGGEALLISEVRSVAHLVPTSTALIAVAFLVVGFGTKAGIAPFHPWLPDAHAEAPTPVSVLLSGVMIKMAAYALTRTVSVFYPTWPQLTVFAVALGTFTMLLGVILALSQQDLKRMLAYSSVSQMGYVLAGVGLGTYLGCFGGLFHLLNHALFKSLLFMCVGAVIYATGLRRIGELGGLARSMPITSACFVVGALAISGMPPFNGFLSKLTVYLALARAGLWWAVVLAMVTSVLTLVVMVRVTASVFWGSRVPPEGGVIVAREVPATMWVPMVGLALVCLLLGVLPQVAFPLLDQAAGVLATVGR